MIQLRHVVNGEIVPMKCNSNPQEVRLLAEYKRHDIRVTNMCIEGQIVVVTHSDVGQGGGLQMIQLQHDVGGKIFRAPGGDTEVCSSFSPVVVTEGFVCSPRTCE